MLYTIDELKDFTIIAEDEKSIMLQRFNDPKNNSAITRARISKYMLNFPEVREALRYVQGENASIPELPPVLSIVFGTMEFIFSTGEDWQHNPISLLNLQGFDSIDVDFAKHNYTKCISENGDLIHWINKNTIPEYKLNCVDEMKKLYHLEHYINGTGARDITIPIKFNDVLQFSSENNIITFLNQLII